MRAALVTLYEAVRGRFAIRELADVRTSFTISRAFDTFPQTCACMRRV